MRGIIAALAATLLLLGGCSDAFPDSPEGRRFESSVTCTDVKALHKRALEYFKNAEASGDRRDIPAYYAQANFMATLAIVAQLRCTAPEPKAADDLIARAVAKANKALGSSDYDTLTIAFQEGEKLAHEAAQLLLSQKN